MKIHKTLTHIGQKRKNSITTAKYLKGVYKIRWGREKWIYDDCNKITDTNSIASRTILAKLANRNKEIFQFHRYSVQFQNK